MSLNMNALTLGDLGFPRVSGDEPAIDTFTGSTDEFSPRERG